MDFGAGDVIVFDQVDGISSFADLSGNISDNGSYATIYLQFDRLLLLDGVLATDLTADDFSFI